MPQMSPMDWVFLNIYFIFLYFFILLILYFININNYMEDGISFKSQVKSMVYLLKWY